MAADGELVDLDILDASLSRVFSLLADGELVFLEILDASLFWFFRSDDRLDMVCCVPTDERCFFMIFYELKGGVVWIFFCIFVA